MALIQELRKQGDFLFRYRGTLPLIILAIALAVYIWEVHYGALYSSEYKVPVRILGLLSCLVGLGIRIHAVGHAAKNTSGRNTADGQVADELNSTGLYSVVRHPLYLGNFFMWLGPALWTMNLWFIAFFIVAYWLYYERIMFAEEAYLRDKFGERYENWAAGRPAFVPALKGYVKPKYAMNWRKIIRQEKNGFAAIFIVFGLFDMLGDFFTSQEAFPQRGYWFYAAIVSVVIYLIVKALKRQPILQDR